MPSIDHSVSKIRPKVAIEHEISQDVEYEIVGIHMIAGKRENIHQRTILKSWQCIS